MAYRRTENVVRRLAAREQTIVDAAPPIAGESGMGAVQIAAVANMPISPPAPSTATFRRRRIWSPS